MKKSKFSKCFDELNFVNFRKIKEGLSLEKYFGEYEGQQAVLRIFSENGYYGNRYLREKIALQNLQHIKNNKIVFPKLLNFNDNYHCLIVTWIDGENIDLKINEFDISNFISQYNSIFNNFIPKINPDINLINDLRKHLFVLPSNENEYASRFKKSISTLFDNLFFEKEPINLIHGDLNYTNIIMNKEGRIGIIDWEYSSFGSTNYDIAYFLVSLDNPKLLMNYSELKKWFTLVYAVNTHWFIHFEPTGQNCKKWNNLLENSIEFNI